MKQTAVEFISKGLFDILQEAENNNIWEVGTQNFMSYIEMFEKQAKEMEKEKQLELIQFLAEREDFKEYSSMSIFIAEDYLNQFKNK